MERSALQFEPLSINDNEESEFHGLGRSERLDFELWLPARKHDQLEFDPKKSSIPIGEC